MEAMSDPLKRLQSDARQRKVLRLSFAAMFSRDEMIGLVRKEDL